MAKINLPMTYENTDLADAIANIQVNAEIAMAIANHLPDDALTQACVQLFGERGGFHFERMIIDMVNTDLVDHAPYDRIVQGIVADRYQ